MTPSATASTLARAAQAPVPHPAAGGGRELAYVALSRARHGTTLHTVAEDLAQAREVLARDWEVERGQRWIGGEEPPHPGPALQQIQPTSVRLDGSQRRARREELGRSL